MSRSKEALGDLTRLTLSDAARCLQEGLFSSEELTRGYLERIKEHDGRIHAWVHIDADRAVADARRADRILRDEGPLGALHGIPLGVKDIICTKAMPTGMGSPIYAGFVPDYSAACVERLELAGAFVQGKTVTTEFAHQHPGPTVNPWNPAYTPGGSSSGSAAAVAAGFTCAALGTQTRGSIIRPAVYCGVVGYKPSFGLISRYGVNPLSATLDHVGVITRSVEDAALLASCVIGQDARDAGSIDAPKIARAIESLGDLAEPPSLAAIRTPSWDAADRAQQDLFDQNCVALRANGARVDSVELTDAFRHANDAATVIQSVEMAYNYRALCERSSEGMSAKFLAVCDRGRRYPAVDYRAALDARASLRAALEQSLAGYDAIVTLAATGEAPHTIESTGDATFCAVWTLCGVPSIAVPTGVAPSGMPMGMQVVGPYLGDQRALQVAKWCMECLPFSHRVNF